MKDTRLFQFAVIALVTAMPSTGRAADNPPATATTAAVQQDDDGPCQFIRKFAADRLGTRIEGKDLQDLQKDLHHLHFPCVLPPSTPINFVIASVPNPIETHLQPPEQTAVPPPAFPSAAGQPVFCKSYPARS